MSSILHNFYIALLQKNELEELLSFLVKEIYDHFNYTTYTEQDFHAEIAYLLKEDISFFEHSIYYVLRDCETHKIHGSIKTTCWDKKAVLPIEKLFNVQVLDTDIAEARTIWHVGRFVISNKIPAGRISILKKMLFNAFYPIHYLGNGVLFAECDNKLVLTLHKLGIPSYTLGASIDYICSETSPIYITSEWLSPFINLQMDNCLTAENIQAIDFFEQCQAYISNNDYALVTSK